MVSKQVSLSLCVMLLSNPLCVYDDLFHSYMGKQSCHIKEDVQHYRVQLVLRGHNDKVRALHNRLFTLTNTYCKNVRKFTV